MVVFSQLQHYLGQFLGVGGGTVIFKVELDLLDGLGEHEVVLRGLDLFAVDVPLKLLMDLYNFLEVQLLKVNVHPAYEEVDEIALLQLVIPHAPQRLEHLRQLPVEVVEGLDPVEALAVLKHEVHAGGDGEQFGLEVFVGEADAGGLGEAEDLADEELDDLAVRVLLLALHRALVQAEEDRDHLGREEVGVVHLNLINSNISIIFCHASPATATSPCAGPRKGPAGRIRGSTFGPFRNWGFVSRERCKRPRRRCLTREICIFG